MPFYEFVCPSGHKREYCESIQFGPPKNVTCDCGKPMHQEFGGNFILKGDGWPGKSLKEREYKSGAATEEMQDMISKEDRAQRIADEVMAVRRQGKEATKRFKAEHPEKYKEYREGIKRGVRGKSAKKNKNKL